MGIISLLDRLQSNPVPALSETGNLEGTAKPEENQDGSLGSLGSRTKRERPETAPSYRLWSIRHADGSLWSHSFTPRATLGELMRQHPHALAIEPDLEDGHA